MNGMNELGTWILLMKAQAVPFLAVLLLLGLSVCGLAQAQGCRFNCTGEQSAPSNQGAGTSAPAVNRGAPPIRSRFGVPIPTCPFGMGYSIEHQQCIPVEQFGGTIPCSQDDQTFAGGRWVPNCR